MNGYAPEQIQAILEEQAGKKFHPEVAKAYLYVLKSEEAKTV
jgi:hypothetical protein